MGHQWIIDVIVDLKTFAQQNDLPVLADELDRAAGVAEAEIDQSNKGAVAAARGDRSEPRRIFSQT